MSETPGLKESTGENPAWLAAPLLVFALIALTVGLVARRTVREPYATPFFHPFFTDTLSMKAWLVTAAVVLACAQLLTAARIYELLRFPPAVGRFYNRVHRWSKTGGDPADASGGLPLCLLARVRYPQPARLDSLAARIGPLRRGRRQGADCSIDEVRALGAPRRWRPLVLNPSWAVADLRVLVVYRRSLCDMTVTDGPSTRGFIAARPGPAGRPATRGGPC